MVVGDIEGKRGLVGGRRPTGIVSTLLSCYVNGRLHEPRVIAKFLTGARAIFRDKFITNFVRFNTMNSIIITCEYNAYNAL